MKTILALLSLLLLVSLVTSERYFWTNPNKHFINDWKKDGLTSSNTAKDTPANADRIPTTSTNHHRKEQEIGTRPPQPVDQTPPPLIIDEELFEICIELSIILSSESETEECYCDFNPNGGLTLYCEDSCLMCDDSGESCGQSLFGFWMDNFFDLGTFSNFTASFEYTSGQYSGDEITFETFGCDQNGICLQCNAYVNGQQCERCEICDATLGGFEVDCKEAIDEDDPNSSFNYCIEEEISGVFGAILYENDVCPDEPIAPNGLCSNATFLSSENPSVVQTLNGATGSEPVPSFCYREQPSTGVWFAVVGTGNVMQVTTCSELTFTETAIGVYENGCGSLQCVVDAVQAFECSNSFRGGRSVSWQSEEGMIYHIMVGSLWQGTAQFEIILYEVSDTNPICGATAELEEQALEIDGPPIGGAIDEVDEPVADPCFRAYGPGAWYLIEPQEEDMVLRASTCSGITNFYTGISILEGDDCETLSCVTGAGPFEWIPDCIEGGVAVEWSVTAGVTYRVLVHGEQERGIGLFSLEVKSLNPPPNDNCGGAIEIGLGDSIDGSLVDATLSGENSFANGTTASSCAQVTGPGVWYVVAGSGNAMRITATTFDYSSVQLSMYDGSCDDLTCITTGSDNSEFAGASVSFDSVVGEVYYLLVQSYYSRADVVFALSVNEANPPENDDCADVIPIVPGSGEVVIGSTLDAIYDGVDFCIQGGPTAGLWYSVIGTGQAMRADTCVGSEGDPEISVFSGTCGGPEDLVCVGSNDDSPDCGLNSVVTWPTEEGIEYFIRVKSLYQSGLEFYLTLTEFEPVENDVCSTGLPILAGESIAGTMTGASQDNIPGCASPLGFTEGLFQLPGVWYYIDGESMALRASTCSRATNIYSAILVFRGTCDELICTNSIPVEDFNCLESRFPAGTTTWYGERGQRYYILVTGYKDITSGSDFELTVSSFNPVANDRCQGAVAMDLSAPIQSGTLVDATTLGEGNTTYSCSFSQGPGVWFSLTGTGSPMRVIACSFEVDITLSLYSGSCDSLNCTYRGDYWQRCEGFSGSAVTVDSTANEVMYLLVQSYGSEGGFELSFEEITRPENDECSAAVGPIEPGSEVIFGSTLDAAIDDMVLGCSSGAMASGLWYSVIGNGQLMRADTCSPLTSFDTEIAIYGGPCGSQLDCISSNDDACGLSSSIVWESVEGEGYLIRVSGFGGGSGDFGLTISALEPTENGECSTRLALAPEASVIQTLDTLFEEEPLPICFYEPSYNGIWFEVVGTGNVLSVSTCSPNTLTESSVAVYRGECGLLECVASSEQRPYCYNYFGGGSITWQSEAGLSYKVVVGSRYPLGGGNNNNGNDDDMYYGDDAIFDEENPFHDDENDNNSNNNNNNGNFPRLLEEEDYHYSQQPPFPEYPPEEDYEYHGYNGVGPFGSQVEVTLYEVVPASNVCEESILLEVDGPSVTGALSVNSPDGTGDACSNAYLPGGWYRVESSVDGVLRASTCSEVTDFSSAISIMQGNCANLICTAAADEFEFKSGCGEGGARVDWPANAGSSYYVLVHGGYGDIGIFGLDVTLLTPPANDACAGAVELSLDGPTTGSLSNATMVGEDTSCSFSSSAGVWYLISGNGNPVRVSLCSDTIFDIALTAYTGSCDSLICAGIGDSGLVINEQCRGQSLTLSLETEPGETLHILVQGSAGGSVQGDTFDLTVDEIMPPENDDCSSAAGPIEPNTGLVFGSTLDAIYDGVDTCILGGLSGGLWYKVIGTGQAMQADTCSSTSSADPEIAVFGGTCGSELECLASNDDACGLNSQVSWLSEAGVDYFVRVKALYGSTDFSLDIAAFDPVENDFCATGLPLRPGDNIVGNTIGATADSAAPYCNEYFFPEASGVWYYVDGQDMALTASLCSPGSDFYGFLYVFVGSCDELTCVPTDSNENLFCRGDFPGFTVNWFGEEGQRYYVLVSEVRTQGGTYQLTLSTVEVADNDSCLNPIELTVDGPPIPGSTAGASPENSAVCRYSNSPGLWYSIVGNGMLINVTTCSEELNFDAVITVSTGSCDENQECVFFAALNEFNCFSSFYTASTAVWLAGEGVTYYLYVQAANDFDVGEFALTVTTKEIAENDGCPDALPIDTNGTVVTGSTLGASYDASIPVCSNFESPDVWYSVQGTGGFLMATTCHDETDYDTALAVYASVDGSCNEMGCIRSNDDGTDLACASTRSAITWFSDESVTYLVRVHGFSLSTGNFGFSVSGDSSGGASDVPGDTCFDAIPAIPDGSLIVGSTTDASISENMNCGPRSPDVWYAVNGTGTRIDASLCNDETDYDTYMSLFNSDDGDCLEGFSTCLADDDASCGLASEISWIAEPEVLYYIRVHGFGTDSGNYGLTITANMAEPPENDICENAIAIEADGSLITGSTDNAIVSDIACGRPSPDVWYIVAGVDAAMTASLCSEETDFDTYMAVFNSVEGDCVAGFDQCLTDDDGGCGLTSQISWTGEVGVTYYIKVHSFGTTTGNFGLTVTATERGPGPDNDLCENAIELDASISNILTGDTSNAIDSGATECITSTSQSADVWYHVIGDGGNLIASTCSVDTTFDTQIAIFEGNDCMRLTCLTGNDDACGLQSSVEWNGMPGVTYYIRLLGYSGQQGQFELTVGPADASGGTNDSCENAITVNPFSTYEGTTVGASNDPLLTNCGGATAVVSNGVWYTAIGDGFNWVASTCEGTNFDTQISVFTGINCRDLDCVDGSDQYCGDQSLVEWTTVPGLTYYILVHGYLSSEGDFTLGIFYGEEVEEEGGDQ